MKYYYLLSLLAVLFSFSACTQSSNTDSHTETEEHIHNTGEEGVEHDKHNHEEHGHEHEGESENANTDEIVIDQNKAKAAGIVVETVHPSQFNGIIKATGEILATRENETSVVATVGGTVRFCKPLLEGNQVSRNEVLFTISSGNIEGGDISEKARITFEIAEKEYKRISSLYDEKIVSEKDYNDARQAYEDARLNYEAIGRNNSHDGQKIKSSMAGFVKSCLVREGEYVQPGQPLLIVTQDSHLYLRAEVPERYYNQVYKICGANFRTPYNDTTYSTDDLNGRLLSVGRASDGNSYYIPVTFQISNSGDIIAGSYVEVYLKTSSQNNTISLPLTAITEEQDTYFVYKQMDATCYRKAEVKLGESDGRRVEIVEGVSDGENVVTKGAYQVKLASAISSIPAHSHEH